MYVLSNKETETFLLFHKMMSSLHKIGPPLRGWNTAD